MNIVGCTIVGYSGMWYLVGYPTWSSTSSGDVLAKPRLATHGWIFNNVDGSSLSASVRWVRTNGGVNTKVRKAHDLRSLCPISPIPAELGQKLTTRRTGPGWATVCQLDILVTWWHDFGHRSTHINTYLRRTCSQYGIIDNGFPQHWASKEYIILGTLGPEGLVETGWNRGRDPKLAAHGVTQMETAVVLSSLPTFSFDVFYICYLPSRMAYELLFTYKVWHVTIWWVKVYCTHPLVHIFHFWFANDHVGSEIVLCPQAGVQVPHWAASELGDFAATSTLFVQPIVEKTLVALPYKTFKQSCVRLVMSVENEVLWYFRPMRQFLQFTGARRVAFPMGSYGSPSIKMTVFLVSFGYILCIFFLFGTPAQSNFNLLLS